MRSLDTIGFYAPEMFRPLGSIPKDKVVSCDSYYFGKFRDLKDYMGTSTTPKHHVHQCTDVFHGNPYGSQCAGLWPTVKTTNTMSTLEAC